MSAHYDPEHITYFAETDYRNQRNRFGIKSRDRTRHMYVIGKSGVGKSTLLENMAIQDIINGDGVAVLDPHGSFAEKMLDYVPEHRIKDVVYFAPFDSDYPISFNVLEDVGPEKRHLVVSGLMSTFKKIWVDAWSARMEYILSNTLLALLEYPDSTLLGVNRMLSDKEFRKKVVDNISDSAVKAFWTEEFAKYTERMAAEAVPAIQNKIGQLTANPLIRNIIGQPKSSFDIREVMDKQKILIINLSKGRIGEQNTALLGSMIITKIYLGAMSRADASPARMSELPNFYFYVDEFQSFANETFANILSEARKYKLALIIAHQYVAQMEEPVRDAVFGNVGTSISFRVGPLDAELMEKAFAPQFTGNDLINLGMAQIYLSLMINDMGSPPFSARTLPPTPRPAITYRNDIIEWSRKTYAAPKESVETSTREWFALGTEQKEYRGDDRPKKTSYIENTPRVSATTPPHAQSSRPAYTPRQPSEYKERVPTASPTVTPHREHSAPSGADIPLPEKKMESPKVHTPFAKAFVQSKPKPEAVTTANTPEKELPMEKNEHHSPALKNLLSSLSFEKKDDSVTTRPFSTPEKIPFEDDKPLRVPPLPFKHAERGPTEKNRDLLKAALGKVLESTSTTLPPHPSSPRPVPVAGDPSSGEISLKELKKILE